jgi:hypothetical protein
MSNYLPDGCTQEALDRYHQGDDPPVPEETEEEIAAREADYFDWLSEMYFEWLDATGDPRTANREQKRAELVAELTTLRDLEDSNAEPF